MVDLHLLDDLALLALHQLHRLRERPRVLQVVLQKSAQIRQLVLYISNNKGYVDGFVGRLTLAKRICEHFPG